jgi:predicted HAD superfamily phosphohydrolase
MLSRRAAAGDDLRQFAEERARIVAGAAEAMTRM